MLVLLGLENNTIADPCMMQVPLLIHKTNNFNNDSRNKNLLNAFFGSNSDNMHQQQIEDDLEDISIDDDTKFNKFSNQTKSKLKMTISYGLDGNIRNDQQQVTDGMLKNELDLEQHYFVDEQKQNLLKLKPKLSNRYNRLNSSSNRKVDLSGGASSEEKKLKYKKYLKNNDYYLTPRDEQEQEYPLKKLKLVSQKSVSKQYIALDESIMRNKLNNLIDLGLFNARRFRINWFHPLKYSCLTEVGASSSDALEKSGIFSLTSPNLMLQIRRLNMSCSTIDSGDNEVIIKNNCIQYLQIQLKNSTKEIEAKLPHFKQNIGNKIIFDFHSSTQEMRNKIGKNKGNRERRKLLLFKLIIFLFCK